MFHLSDLTISFHESRDYVRISIVIYTFTVLALYMAHFPVSICMLVGVVSFWLIKPIMQTKKPYPHLSQLAYREKHWVLYEKNAEEHFDNMSLRINAGFFILLTLSKAHSHRNLIVFHDQMTQADCRMLQILSE